MIKLSVNINKLATLRNARGGNYPNVLEAAKRIQQFGANGITVHPRPDERHITYQDVLDLKNIVHTEFNIEGNPTEDKFVDLVLRTKPTQVTFVPDALGQITSNHGWNTIEHKSYLKDIIAVFKKENIRTSIFVDPVEDMIIHAKETGTDCVELYTESYAKEYRNDKHAAIAPYVKAAQQAKLLNVRLNAGHDLDLNNLTFFAEQIPYLSEVSIGHALICDAIYLGLENTVQMYKRCLQG